MNSISSRANYALPESRPKRGLQRLLAAIVAVFLAMAGVVTTAGAATAALPTGIESANLLLNGQKYNGVDVVKPGDELTFKVQYNKDAVGQVVPFKFNGNVTVPGVPVGNEAIESINQEGNDVTITFKDPWPASIDQGVFDLKLKVGGVANSGTEVIAWEIGDDKGSVTVIIEKPGDSFENVSDGVSKSRTSAGDLRKFVSVVGGNVVIDPKLADEVINYRLNVNSKTVRDDFSISDQLPAEMSYVSDSFKAKLTTWDEDGLNRTIDADYGFNPTITGNSFAETLNLPGPSQLEVTYSAKITNIAALQVKLQATHDAMTGSGDFVASLTNTADFDGEEKTATVKVIGNIPAAPKPGPGNSFAKDASWQKHTVASSGVIEDGTLTPAVPIQYTLKADLTKLQNGSDYVLKQNVIITDTLPTQLSWDVDAADFLTATNDFAITKLVDCDNLATDANVGKYCVDGKVLKINVGKDHQTNTTFTAKALLNTIEGLEKVGNQTSIAEATSYKFRNEATFAWDTNELHKAGYDSFPSVLPESEDGYNDPNTFSKTGNAPNVIKPGETVAVDYTFKVGQGKGVDVTKSKIVDYVDTEIFDLSDLSKVKVSGHYDWWPALEAEHFTLSTDDVGNLVIELSDKGKAIAIEKGPDKNFEVNIKLTTKPFEGKETKEIKNKATLFGFDDDALNWSETESEVTSYGDEAEVRKRVYDRTSEDWVATIDAQIGADGELVESTYVYRIEFIPHGSYNQVAIVPVVDILPAGLEFIGFVTEENAGSAESPTKASRDIGGNLEVGYVDGVVTIKQKPGTVLSAGEQISAYFAVEVTDHTAPIINKIGGTEAKIVPIPAPSIDIEKWTVEESSTGPAYNADNGSLTNDGYVGDFDDAPGKGLATVADQEVKFTVSNDGGEVLKDVKVTDETTAGAGEIENLVCTFPDDSTGTTWEGPFEPATQFECVGTVTGLETGKQHTNKATVSGVGITSGDSVEDEDKWNAYVKSYAIGDVVWVDTNRDGIQGETEFLKDVTVTLLDGEGGVIDTTTTDEDGRYIFDNLPAGEYQVEFTLTEEQSKKYNFTSALSGSDKGKDSDADLETGKSQKFTLGDATEGLTQEYDREFGATEGIDPTWDAGVVVKTYAIGDVVWIDTDRKGDQNEQTFLEGVTVTLLRANVDGVFDVVTKDALDQDLAPYVTGQDGKYIFDNLPAGEYKVQFELTDEQAAKYKFTDVNVVEDNTGDSDAIVSEDNLAVGVTKLIILNSDTPGLTQQYEDQEFDASEGVDPTWDAGVVLKSVSVGDFVWFDKNRDGAQDEGEPGIPGVVLELVGPDGKPVTDVFGEPVDRVTTGENGEYTFENLPVLKGEEVYTVVIVEEDPSTVEALKPYVPTYEEGAERDKDSSTWESESLTLTEDGERDDTLDFGFILKSYGIGDVVWIDSNNNGLQDYETEEPLSGVTVTLFRVLEDGTLEEVTEDIDGDVVEPQVTDEDGWYMFDYLPAGNYQVQFELTDEQATKYIFTSYVSGDDDSIDSNANPTTGFTDVIALNDDNENLDLEYLEGDFGASEGIDPTWDAGVVVKTYAIGDIVWVDTNRDGIQGETEVLEGVTVTLLNDKGDVITSTKTDKNGRYIFDVLPAGDYQVKFELTKEQAAKYKFTSVNSGKDAKADSDADLGTGLTKVFKLDDNSAGLTTDYKDQTFEANQGIDPTWDAGVVLKSVSVGDFVWEDKDGNGRQDKGEPGIPGVVLEVTGPDGKPVTDVYGNPVKPATTDKDGKYTFENLPVLEPGQCYTVTINQKESAKALEKYLPTKSGAGDRGGDSSTWTVCSEGLTEDGERDDTLDFGFVLNPEFLAVTGTNLLVPVSVATLALGAGAYLVLRNRKTGSRRA